MSAGKNFFLWKPHTNLCTWFSLSFTSSLPHFHNFHLSLVCASILCVSFLCFYFLFSSFLHMTMHAKLFFNVQKNIHSSWITDFACALVNSSHENIIKLINWLQLSERVMILHSTAYTFQSKFVTFKFMICQVEILYFHTLGMLNKI